MFLLKAAYFGWMFSGSQLQPERRTVESELCNALGDLGWLDTRLGFASRTDSGVSALGNVFAYKGRLGPLGRLNHMLKGIRVWAYAEVPDSFKPRNARLRWYRYFLVGDFPESEVRKIKQFEGTHDFSEYTRARRNTVRTIDSIRIHRFGYGYVLDFKAKSFLWNQIRRMVGTVLGRTAPPEPLILMEIGYENEPAWSEDRKQLRALAKDWETEFAMCIIKNTFSKAVI